MNKGLRYGYRAMRLFLSVALFCTRHFLAVFIPTLVGCILWTLLYIVLLLLAILTNSGLGGPLAYPAGILLIVLACVTIGWGIFAPACGVGWLVCKTFGWPHIAAIPFVFAAAAALSNFSPWFHGSTVTGNAMASVVTVLKNFTLFLSLPLGVYWWLTEGPWAVIDAFRRWIWKHLPFSQVKRQSLRETP